MKKRLVLTLGIATAIVATTGVAMKVRADRRDVTVRAALRGLNEVPPTTSRGSATMNAQLDVDAQTLTFTINYQNLTAAPLVAHIHFGPTKVNGGVMFFFCGGGGKPACPATTSGTITGTVTPADVVGPVNQGVTAGDFADVVRAIATGNAYANIHTSTFTGGEVRGRAVAFGLSFGDDDQDD
jgi:CHRD domain-containing protein